MQATIKDVANKTGLSIFTISKYMNGGSVREKNRLLIEQAIEELGYVPNMAAKGLRDSRTYCIGLIIDTLNNPYSAALAGKLEAEFHRQNYSLIMNFHENKSGRLIELLEYYEEKQLDGVVFQMPECRDDQLFGKIMQFQDKVPMLCLNDVMLRDMSDCDCVMTNYSSAFYRAAEYLIRKGHTKIALLCGESYFYQERAKREGAIRAMKDYDLPIFPEWMPEGDCSYESGKQRMQDIWEGSEKPTAVITSGNDLTIGLLAAAKERGLVIPEDLSVIACDDREISSYYDPPLTSIILPEEEIAGKAAELLLERCREKDLHVPRRIVKEDVIWVERKSVKEVKTR